jgi:ATP-binding cassette subfamily F protein uup
VIETMSGGERRRVALASLLVQEWDLLVLDEPDQPPRRRGRGVAGHHLKGARSSQAHLVVTHDRWFLDEVNTRTWEVHDGVVDAYEGGYSAYVLGPRRARPDRLHRRAEAPAAGEEGARLAASRPARAHQQAAVPDRRRERAHRRRAAGARRHRAAALLRRRLGKTVYELHGVTLAFGKRTLFDGVDWNIGPGDRSASSASTAPASRRCSRCSSGSRSRTAAASSSGRP